MNILELSASLDLDTTAYEEKLAGLAGQTSQGSSKLSGALSSFAGNLASDLAMKGINAITQGAENAVGAVVDLTKQSLNAYSAYEQLSGGVETLFGDSYNVVMENAANAFSTAGMSANQYMETVTSFSASLLQGLGGNTELAAEIADRAIIDMSDNANKMGTDISSIQTAYAGFAKQNYTMLDNLKLGYGGTKEEMERLIADASTMTDAMDILGVSVDAESLSFDNIINAISVVQTNMGIAGTTAEEASTTIEGSTLSMKAAWENLLAGFGNGDADLGALVEQFTDTVVTAARNIVPRLGEILKGVGSGFSQILPIIVEELPTLWSELVPPFIQGGFDLIKSLITGVTTALPSLIETGMDMSKQMLSGLTESIDPIIDAVFEFLEMYADAFEQYYPEMMEMGTEILFKIIEGLLAHLGDIIIVAAEIQMAILNGLIEYMPTILTYVPELIGSLVMALIESIPKLIVCALDLITAFVSALLDSWDTFTDGGYWAEMIMRMVNVFADYDWASLGKNIIDGLIDGLVNNVKRAVDSVKNIAQNVMTTFKDTLGIASPSKKFKYYGEMITEGLTQSLDDGVNDVFRSASGLANSVMAPFDNVQAGIGTSAGVANGGGVINQVININQQIATADELAREIRIESRYGLMRGGALA